MIKYKYNLDLEKVVEQHNMKGVKVVSIKLDGVAYKTEQILQMHNYLKKGFSILEDFDISFKYKISLRKGMIIILEEKFYDINEYPEELILLKIEKEANVRFSINHRDKSNLDTATKIHPKNPCKYYNFDGMAKLRVKYEEALSSILETPFLFFEIEEAIESLSNTYNEFIEFYRTKN